MKTYSTPTDLLLMDELCKAVVFLGAMSQTESKAFL
jgi:hypothetical protein